ASTISRKRVTAQKLQSPEEVLQVFTERFKVKFGEWLYRGAFGNDPYQYATLLAPVHAQQEQKLITEEVLPDEHSYIENAAAEPDTPGGTSSGETSTWPLRYSLTGLNEETVLAKMADISTWVRDWHQYEKSLPEGVTMHWVTRRWSRLGEQTLPLAVTVENAEALAQWTGFSKRWKRACVRRDEFIEQFEITRYSSLWIRHSEVLADWAEEDIERLQTLLGWFFRNPSSGLYLRQLPVPKIDTKWIETRKAIVRDFTLAINGRSINGATQDFHEVCGLRKPASKLRLRILCPKLRASLGGLCDIEAPAAEISRMPLSIRAAFIVENLETGLALPDFEGMVAFMRLGHAISELAHIPWLCPDHLEHSTQQGCFPRLLYWGDLDTHGFAILSRARGIFSRLRSVLMDETTFLQGQALWVTELTPFRAEELKHLTPTEQDLYIGLRNGKWGANLRLEQERLPWPKCLQALQEAVSSPST
ncbi:MAG: hypothetical protein JF626_04665, partial [Polaromonas sp.]|nr:hypothetical protein [Polaromonas sp.]